jgi:hypoxanthine phosphoribosyltransferase
MYRSPPLRSHCPPDRSANQTSGSLVAASDVSSEGRARRVRWVSHRGKQILLVDAINCTGKEVTAIAGEVQRIVAAQPRNSVLVLSDLTGARFSRNALTRMKEVAVFDRPHVKKSAMVGTESLPDVF